MKCRAVVEIIIDNYCPSEVNICIKDCNKCWLTKIKEVVDNEEA